MSVAVETTPASTLELRCRSKADRIAALRALGRDGRRRAFEDRELSYEDCCLWAALFPSEPPTIDGEYVWIAATMPEVCE